MTTQSYDIETIDRLYATNAALVETLADMLDMMGPLDDVANIKRKNIAHAALKLAKGEGK